MIKEAMLYEKKEGSAVACLLCSHRCVIAESKFGFCGVRQNLKGKLHTHVYGQVIASHVDPIEKKPLFHFLPGSSAFSIATVGCNFRCGFCQNWQISQVSARNGGAPEGYELKPEEAVRQAKKYNCASISYTYTEPTIFFEYAYDTAKTAKKESLYNTFVTNGFMTAEALWGIRDYLDACNVDLKSFRDSFYKKFCKARLKPVLESVRLMRELGIWVEVTTLVVPGENDSYGELKDIAGFIAGVDKNIPWHVSRFHPDYKYTASAPTPIKTLKKAETIGKKEGLRYVYIGNVPGEAENTSCSGCNKVLIERHGFSIARNDVKDSRCPHCGAEIAGVF